MGPDRLLARDIEASVTFTVGGGALLAAELLEHAHAWQPGAHAAGA